MKKSLRCTSPFFAILQKSEGAVNIPISARVKCHGHFWEHHGYFQKGSPAVSALKIAFCGRPTLKIAFPGTSTISGDHKSIARRSLNKYEIISNRICEDIIAPAS